MRTLSDALNQRVLLTDGSLARQLRAQDVNVARDLFGVEDCLEVLNVTRSKLVREAHLAYLRAGADVIRTNALGASPLSLREKGLEEQAFYLNFAAAQIACEAVDAVPGRGRRRFVLGVVRDFGWDVSPKELETAVGLQVEGLLAGGVDAVALDLVPGTGRAPFFLRGARKAKASLEAAAPIYLQCGLDASDFSPRNKELSDGQIRFTPGKGLKADRLAQMIEKDRINLVGGGTAPEDTLQLDRQLRAEAEDGLRPYGAAWRALGVERGVEEVTIPSSCLDLDPAVAEVG
ncbi:homocysteine S-methyltransferase family protein [Rhodovibrionaceae bacterium A322]